MKIKRISALLLAAILVLALIPAVAFAEAPAEEELFEIYGWFDYGEEDVVTSVTLGGEELVEFGSEVVPIFAAPGDKMSIKVTLAENYELGILEENNYFWWVIGEGEDYVPAGRTTTEVTLPDAEYLEENTVITLAMRSVTSDIPEPLGVIESVVINAPVIKVGEGYDVVEYTDDYGDIYYIAEPGPAVTVPAGEPYALDWYEDENGERFEYAYWVVKDGDDYYYPEDAAVFEYDTDYYIEIMLYATDIDDIVPEKAADDMLYRFFCLNRPPKITVNNGELVDFEIVGLQGPKGGQTRMDYEDFSPYMWVLIKVNVPSPQSPDTSDMDPNTWVWTMILSVSAVLTAAYYELKDIRRAKR